MFDTSAKVLDTYANSVPGTYTLVLSRRIP
jgi:hypothetical protein